MKQNTTVIALRSLTHAMKAQKLLREHGIDSRVVKPDNERTEKGCGYGIELDRALSDKAEALLRENALKPLNIK